MFSRQMQLGSWLTLLNCGSWLTLSLIAPAKELSPDFLQAIALCFTWMMALPVAWYWMLPSGHHSPTLASIFLMCCVVGLNSLLWGYGLAAISNRLRQYR